VIAHFPFHNFSPCFVLLPFGAAAASGSSTQKGRLSIGQAAIHSNTEILL
jgi:hypothetical protein